MRDNYLSFQLTFKLFKCTKIYNVIHMKFVMKILLPLFSLHTMKMGSEESNKLSDLSQVELHLALFIKLFYN